MKLENLIDRDLLADYHDELMKKVGNYATKEDIRRGVFRDCEAVDLGLPSGTLWADRNVGALTPEASGLYFSWGNVEGHTREEGYSFTGNSYNHTTGASLNGNIPVGDTYDAARANMGGSWKMPTWEQFGELRNGSYCSWTWVTDYNGVKGANGFLVSSRSNGGSIFLPAAGNGNSDEFKSVGSSGDYWSSSIDTGSTTHAMSLYFDGGGSIGFTLDRFFGFSVRAVQ